MSQRFTYLEAGRPPLILEAESAAIAQEDARLILRDRWERLVSWDTGSIHVKAALIQEGESMERDPEAAQGFLIQETLHPEPPHEPSLWCAPPDQVEETPMESPGGFSLGSEEHVLEWDANSGWQCITKIAREAPGFSRGEG